MSANDFEKEVEQRLAQLQLKPSDGVWQKLEAGLQRKKRRKTFFLFFLTALLCTGGGYWMWTQSDVNTHDTTGIVTTGTIKDTTVVVPKIIKEEPAPENKKSTVNVSDNPNDLVIKMDEPQTPSINTKALTGRKNKRSQQVVVTPFKATGSKRKTVSPEMNAGVDNNSKTPVATADDIAGITFNQETDTTGFLLDDKLVKQRHLINAGDINNRSYALLNTEGERTIGSLHEGSLPLRVEAKESIITNTQKKYPFYWGIEVMAGVSGAMEKREPSAKSVQMDMNNPITSGYYSNTSPLVSNNAVWESQSIHRASTAHSFGITAYKQLSKRNAFSFGLSYQYLSTATKVGDSALTVNGNNTMRTYYYGRETKNYTNKFHFINIPVTHHLILNKNKNMPFSWDLGMSVSRLLSTNALVTSSYLGGSLLEDKQAFTRTHFFIHTGLTIGLTNNKNSLWQLGPVLNYGLNKIGEQKGDDRNFWEVGIKLRYLFR